VIVIPRYVIGRVTSIDRLWNERDKRYYILH
jgi:hypothetical protein